MAPHLNFHRRLIGEPSKGPPSSFLNDAMAISTSVNCTWPTVGCTFSTTFPRVRRARNSLRKDLPPSGFSSPAQSEYLLNQASKQGQARTGSASFLCLLTSIKVLDDLTTDLVDSQRSPARVCTRGRPWGSNYALGANVGSCTRPSEGSQVFAVGHY